jgi:hypothetical protein
MYVSYILDLHISFLSAFDVAIFPAVAKICGGRKLSWPNMMMI